MQHMFSTARAELPPTQKATLERLPRVGKLLEEDTRIVMTGAVLMDAEVGQGRVSLSRDLGGHAKLCDETNDIRER
jgi:hypothetical protein